MRKTVFIIFFIIISLTLTPAVLAVEGVAAGITPSNPLYFLDTLSEKIGLALTFDPVAKVNKAKNYAAEKSAELTRMLQKNNERGQMKASQRYQEMIKMVASKMEEAIAENSEFKNTFIPQMMVIINDYNGALRTQGPEKIKRLGNIAKEENDLFINTYEAQRPFFAPLNLTPSDRREKLCTLMSTRPIKDEITKVLEALCSQEFAAVNANDKQKQETIYKTIFDIATRNDISDATKGMVQQIALSDLPVSQVATAETPVVKAESSEFKNIKSRQIACYFSCGSYNCPPGQKTEEKFEHKSRRIFDPWDWGGASLIDLLLSSVKVADTPAPALSFAVAEGFCVDSGKVSWQGSGIIDTAKLASENAFNEDTFLNNFQSAFEEARRNCPASGDDSYTFTLMCSVRDFIEGKRYSEQYSTINDKCSANEAEAAQIERTHVHNETWTYMTSQQKTENAEDVDKVEMMITPGGISQTVEFDADTKELKTNGVLQDGDYDYKIRFTLKGGQSISPQGSGGHFTLRPCSQPVFDCTKISGKIILNEYSGQGVCRGANSDRFFLDQFSCVKKDYNEQLEDININVKDAGFCHYSLLDEAREQYNDAIKRRLYSEADALWVDDDELVTEKIDIGDEATLFWLLDPMSASDMDRIDTDHRGLIVVRVGKCHIWAVGNTEVNRDRWSKYHYENLDKLVTEGIITSVNEHPNFDHGRQRLRDLLLEFAREVYGNIKDKCGGL